MSANAATLKAMLRGEMRAKLAALSPEARQQESNRLCQRFSESVFWRAAKAILFYAPLPDEPDVWPLLAASLSDHRTYGLPRYVPEAGNYEARQVRVIPADLVAGRFGIREPSGTCPLLDLVQFDLVLVPGLAFDLTGGRLGRGRGFYDRLLAGFGGKKCGVAFEEQITTVVPMEIGDVRMDAILTPSRYWEERGRNGTPN